MLKRFWLYIPKYKLFHILIIFILIVFISNTYSLVALNNYFYDLFLYSNQATTKQNKIIIVEIDNKSLQELGRWPWDRSYHAKLTKILSENKAKVMAFYLNFDTPSNKKSDDLFIEQLNNNPTIIIDSGITSSFIADKPFWKQISKACELGHNIFTVDKNNILRKYLIFAGQTPSFALAVIKHINKQKYEEYKNKKEKVLYINFKRAADKFPRYSYIDVLNNRFPKNTFKDKAVLIATNSTGLSDYYVTPFSRNKGAFHTGAESAIVVQAQIIDSLLNYKPIKYIDTYLIYIALFVMVTILYYILPRFRILNQIGISFILAPVLVLLAPFIALKDYNLWISPITFLLACPICFTYVSVSMLIKTSKFLDKYISELSGNVGDKLDIQSETDFDRKLSNLRVLTDLIHADRNLLDTVLTSLSNIIMLFDETGKVIYTNHTEYQNNTNISDLTDEINLEHIKNNCTKTEMYTKRISWKGNHYNFFVTLAESGYYVGIFNDVTEIIRMNEMKTDLMRMLSHEFKTPLATILLCSDYMTMMNKTDGMEQYIDQITNQTEFLEEMINNFLALNKLELADFEVTRATVDFDEFMLSIINRLKVIAENKKINLLYNFDEQVPKELKIDQNYLFIAIKNLIDNAIKYSPENTEITVNVTRENQKVQISVKDQGFGISEEDQKKLFEKFYRVKTEKTRVIKGTGLGLSFVKRIIELHGGNIKVKSNVNEGSEFIIQLPIS